MKGKARAAWAGSGEGAIAIIHSRAPIRICDNGGWTDTWFAGHGEVFNMAVSPFAEVHVTVSPAREGAPRIMLHPENFGEPYEVRHGGAPWGPHPLLEAAIASMNVPFDLSLCIAVRSEAPPGAGTGTSAAVTVALLGALDALTPGRMTAHEVAMAAHRVETEWLGRQCGIQDQIAAAYGGVNHIEISAYPQARVSPLNLAPALRHELERRLLLIYLGRSHDSSAIHQGVIRSLENAGPDSPSIVELRNTAARSRDALLAGNLKALGQAMIENTEAQARLHPALVGVEALRVIDIARSHRAAGFKVNGAGGDGGSVTLLLSGESGPREALVRDIQQASSGFRPIPIRLSRHGLQVRQSRPRKERLPRR